MSSSPPVALGILETERHRIGGLLAGNADWLAFQALAVREVKGETLDAAAREQRRQLVTALERSAIFQAWRKIGEALDLLRLGDAALVTEASKTLDDSALTRIRGIDAALAGRLAGFGITRLEQVAALTAADVKRLRRTLELGRRISQECWIEQAAMLLAKPVVSADAGTTAVAPATATSPAAPAPTLTSPSPRTGPGTSSAVEPAQTDLDTLLRPAPAPNGEARPGSLAARLFARTPILGAQRSLLSAIEAAEQARSHQHPGMRDVPNAPMMLGTSGLPGSSAPTPSTSVVGAPARAGDAVRPAQSSTRPALVGEAPAASSPYAPVPAATSTPISVASPRAQAVALTPADTGRDLRPVLAPIEEEADVTIVAAPVKRPKSADAPTAVETQPARPTSSGRILDINLEAQGGEDADVDPIWRGRLEEAAVEIIVRDKTLAAPSAPSPQPPKRPRGRWR